MKLQFNPKGNLFHFFKRNNVYAEDIDKHLKYCRYDEQRLGSLPVDWLKNLSKDEFSSATQKVDDALYEFAVSAEKSSDFNQLFEPLVEALKKILKRNDITIDFEGKGGFKYCQKLTVGDYSYALSTFRAPTKDCYCAKNPDHSQFAEPQKAFWVYKNSPHGRAAKPFMARFCTYTDPEGAYILSKFIDKTDTKRAKTPISGFREKFYPLVNNDNYAAAIRNNEINNILVDVGGIVENASFRKKDLPNKCFRQNLYTFLDRIGKEWNRSMRNPYSKSEQMLIEQIKSGNDIFKMDLRTLNGSPDDIREAIKTVRKLRTVHKLKTKLEANGEFEQYRKYLKHHESEYSDLLRYVFDGMSDL